jgi:hypothetical protein
MGHSQPPKCQAPRQAAWVESRVARTLPIGTLPLAGAPILVAAPARLSSSRRLRNCASARSELRRPRCSFAIAYWLCFIPAQSDASIESHTNP